MKNQLLKYRNILLFGTLLMFTVGCFMKCTKMDDTYEQFWKDGERVYPAPIDSVQIFSGFNRLLLKGLIPKDPNVTKARIFWNFNADSLEIPIESTRTNDTLGVYLSDMDERLYSFIIYTYDKKGNRSVPIDIIGNAYGEVYKKSLLTRLAKAAEYLDGKLEVIWGGSSEKSALNSEIIYLDTSGNKKTILADKDAESTIIMDYSHTGDQTLRYRTSYLPDSLAIDTFYTEYQKIKVRGPAIILPKGNWTATASSYDDRAAHGGARAPYSAIDGNNNSIWVSQIVPQQTFPHDITINMGEVIAEVEGIQILFGNRADTPMNIQIYGSKNGVDWSSLGAYGVLKNTSIQTFEFTPMDMQYFKVVGVDSYGSNNIVIYEIWAFNR